MNWRVLIACGVGAPSLLLAEEPVWEAEDFTLAPKVEAAWEKLVEAARPLRLTGHEEELKKLIASVVESFSLTAEQTAVLEQAVPTVAEEATRHWEQTMRQVFRSPTKLSGDPDEAASYLSGLAPDWLSRFPAHYERVPDALDRWAEAMRKVLTPAAFDGWRKGITERLEKRRLRTLELVTAGDKRRDPEAYFKEKIEEQMGTVWPLVAGNAKLRKAMLKKIGVWAAGYREDSIARSILWMNACNLTGATWPKAEKAGYYFSLVRSTERVKVNVAELMAMLPEETRLAIQAAADERLKQARQLGDQLRVVIVDDAVALTAAQREQIMKLAEAMPINEGLLSDMSNYSYQKPWEDWKEEHLKALNEVLTDTQERQWLQRVKLYERSRLTEKGDDEVQLLRHPDAGPRSPLEVELKISDLISGQMEEKLQVEHLRAKVRADDVARVLELDEPRAERLALMAKGEAVQLAKRHLSSYGDYVRRNLGEATPVNIDVLLGAVGNVSFSSRSDEESILEVWMEKNLRPEERAKLEVHRAEREALWRGVVSQMALAPAEKELALTQEQREELVEELQKVMKDFGPDIDRYFGSRYSAPWFLQSYQSPLPCAGVPEERVKDILTKEQLEVWDTRLLPRATNYWESIQHYHEQRLQMEKQAKEKAPPKLGWIDLNPSARDDLLVANGPSLSPHPLN